MYAARSRLWFNRFNRKKIKFKASQFTYHRVAYASNLAQPEPGANEQDPLDTVALVRAETLRTVARQAGDDVEIVDFSLQREAQTVLE